MGIMENDWKVHRCFKRCHELCGPGFMKQIGDVTSLVLGPSRTGEELSISL